MKPLATVGLVLMGLGIAGLLLGRFSYTTDKKVIDLGPLQATISEERGIDVPDIAGFGAILAGALLIFLSRRGA